MLMAVHEEDEDLNEWEDPDESDQDADDDPTEMPCPYCHRDIDEEADVCPHCGAFVSHHGVATKTPHWKMSIVLTLIAAMAGVLGLLMKWFM
jgi:predicted amidophosphoribosyltransferase